MARPIQYNREAVTDKALSVFWHEGFNGSSVDKLVEATGLNKHSLYKAFEGKDGLFRTCLERYIQKETKPYFDILKQNEGLHAIRCYFELIRNQTECEQGKGCFVANTAVELGCNNAIAQSLVIDYYERLMILLCQAIEQGQEAKEIKPEVAALDTAKWLVHVVQGLALSNRFQSSIVGDVDTLLALIANHPTKRH